MIKKSINPTKGIKGVTDFAKRKSTPHRHHLTVDSEEKVNRCLTCTKPASKCKGDCF